MATRWKARPGQIAAALLMVMLGSVLSLVLAGVVGLGLFVAYAGIGAFLALRLPHNGLGWMLMLLGSGLALGNARVDGDPALLSLGSMDAGQALAVWANGSGWALAFSGIVGLVLLFPDGRLQPGPWRWIGRLVAGTTVVLACLIMLGPTANITLGSGRGMTLDVPNPLAVAPGAAVWNAVPDTTLLYSTLFATFSVGMIGLLARFLKASPGERLQLRWLVSAIVLVAGVNGCWAVVELVLHSPLAGVAFAATLIAYSAVPIAIAIAILRYRLYEIDRIISRTLGYAIVTVILGATFAGLVLGLQALARPLVGSSQVAVAVSTLAVAALFGPLRVRVQRTVDRRFYRSRYDAMQLSEGLATRLRDDLDLEAVRGELMSTADAAFQPASVAVWVRRGQ